jgi:FMN phosphatase YigB (HAD superfamily)
MFDHIKTILFDLDGTVYQNDYFHRIYLSVLIQNTRFASWERELISLADTVLRGGLIPMNQFYQAGAGAVNCMEDVVDALRAGELRELTCEEAYKGPLPDIYYLGDAWALVSLIAQTLRISKEGQDGAFQAVRGRMLQDGITQDPALIEAITALKARYTTVLLSNSPKESAAAFIQQLGLQDAFTHIGYGSGKPYGLLDCLAKFAPDVLKHPGTLLSIGDHVFNEIENIRLLGGKTVWVCPYRHIRYGGCDLRLYTPQELRDFLKLPAGA